MGEPVKKSNDPLWWSQFSAGGVMAALFAPALIVITGLAGPLGWIGPDALSFEHLHSLVAHPLTRLVLL
ncbi:MAG: fumarate reductase subunit FrdD, partial [bacterium]